MREVTRIVYEAFDGETFDSEVKCAAYEKDFAWKRLIGLDVDNVQSAIATGTGEIAEALITVGYRLANMNRGKRVPKANPADKEPFLPDPIGGPDGGPPEPPEENRLVQGKSIRALSEVEVEVAKSEGLKPMTAEQALNHTRT